MPNDDAILRPPVPHDYLKEAVDILERTAPPAQWTKYVKPSEPCQVCPHVALFHMIEGEKGERSRCTKCQCTCFEKFDTIGA